MQRAVSRMVATPCTTTAMWGKWTMCSLRSRWGVGGDGYGGRGRRERLLHAETRMPTNASESEAEAGVSALAQRRINKPINQRIVQPRSHSLHRHVLGPAYMELQPCWRYITLVMFSPAAYMHARPPCRPQATAPCPPHAGNPHQGVYRAHAACRVHAQDIKPAG